MRTPVKLRTLTAEEVTEIKRLAFSRKKPIRLVQRARIIAFMMEDASLYASEAGLKAGFSGNVIGPVWEHRFNKRKDWQDWKTNPIQAENRRMNARFIAGWSI